MSRPSAGRRRPAGLIQGGTRACPFRALLLTARWQQLRAIRNFRPGRVDGLEQTGERFASADGRNLDAYLDARRAYYAGV